MQMSDVTISGTRTLLRCLVRESNLIFSIKIGRNNYVSEFKEIIKMKKKPHFDLFAFDELKLLKLKNPVDYKHISDIQNFILQDDEKENDNIALKMDMRKINYYWTENQDPPKNLIHVIVETPILIGKS
jgi:hypothetical protein